jgi:hypothetical protein
MASRSTICAELVLTLAEANAHAGARLFGQRFTELAKAHQAREGV